MASDDRRKSEKKSIFIAEKLLEKGYTKLVKRLPQMCTTVQLWVGKGDGSFCYALAWWERWEGAKNKMASQHCFLSSHSHLSQVFRLGVKHFGSASNISARRQTFRLGVKHFGLASSKRFQRQTFQLGVSPNAGN